MEEIKKVEQLREDAEHQATASTMKIDVLSDYYKQREKEYNKYFIFAKAIFKLIL